MDNTNPIVVCAKCKHYHLTLGMRFNANHPRCLRTASEPRVDIVTGKKAKLSVHDMMTCRDERNDEYWNEDGNHCGSEGRFWVPKDRKDLFRAIVHASKVKST